MEPPFSSPAPAWTGKRPTRRPDIICQPAGVETLLYDPVADTIHVLNRTALAVWEMCDGRHTPDDIGQQLQKRFANGAAHDVVQDVIATLAVFEREGLLGIQESCEPDRVVMDGAQGREEQWR